MMAADLEVPSVASAGSQGAANLPPSFNTAAARVPSPSGTVASGTKRGSAFAVASSMSLASRLQASPSAPGNS